MVESLEVMIFESINIVPSKGGAAQTSMPRKKRHSRSTKQTLLVISFSAQFGFECLYPFLQSASHSFLFRFRLVGFFRHFPQGHFLEGFNPFL